MCDPITLAATALTVGSTAMQAGGALSGGKAASRAGRLQAEIARANSDMLMQQAEIERGFADFAVQKGAFAGGKARAAGGRTVSSQGAYFSANDIDPLYGSPLAVAGATIQQAEIDAALAEAQGLLDRAGILGKVSQTKAAAASQAGQGLAASQKGDDAMTAAIWGAGTAILNGATKLWSGLSGAAPNPNSGGGFTPSASTSGAPMAVNSYGSAFLLR